MNRVSKILVILVTVVAAQITLGGSAIAQDAAALYEEGKDDLRGGRFSIALDKFKEGMEVVGDDVSQSWLLLLGISLAYEKMEQGPLAIEYYSRLLQSMRNNPDLIDDKWDRRKGVVEEQVSALIDTVMEDRGLVKLRSAPEGARIIVDGAVQGADGSAVTPFVAFLRPGVHKVRFEMEGYKPGEMDVTIRAGQRESVNVPLYKRENKGKLLIRTGDASSTVFVDGSLVGQGDEVVLTLASGTREIMVNVPGRKPYETKVFMEAGKTETLTVEAPAELGVTAPSAGTGLFHARAPIWGWIGVGTGGAMLLTGVICTGLAGADSGELDNLSKKISADPTLSNDATTKKKWDDLNNGMATKQTVAGVMYGLGTVVAAGGAAWLIFFAESGGDKAAAARFDATPSFALLPLPEGGAFSLQWRF